MKIISIFFALFVSMSSLAGENDSISLEIKLVNVMTSASAIYKCENSRIKVYQSKNGKSYRLVSTKRLSEGKQSVITNSIIQLLDNYNFQSEEFSDSRVIDGYDWVATISYKNKVITYKVLNCCNSKIDQVIKVINAELKRKKLIFETGLLYKDNPCE